MSPTLCFRIQAPPEQVERLIAELHSLGTLGIEERPAELLSYFRADNAPAREIAALGDLGLGICVHEPERVPVTDWERTWRAGLEPRRVGSLWIRPSWCASRGTPEILIDPQQAFGSGEHASTRLALALTLEALVEGDRVLDVGTGSGILGLGALRLGAAQALGLEINPQACANAGQNSSRNRLPLALVCGTLETIAPRARFELVLCNMLLSRLAPCVSSLVEHASRALVLSGYLSEERERVRTLVAERDLVLEHEIDERQSGDTWCASLWLQARDLQSASRSSSVSSKR